jgi:cysteine synthase B
MLTFFQGLTEFNWEVLGSGFVSRQATMAAIETLVGATPLVQLSHLLTKSSSNKVFVKLEGNNPAGSVKDRAALSMIRRAEERGTIRPGDTLVEATSGNTGIALSMAAALKGYKMIIVMPENASMERRGVMHAYGARLVLTPKANGIEGARVVAGKMHAEGKGYMLDQFSNGDNPRAHYETTGPEIWKDTKGRVTHFVSAMGTTGVYVGVYTHMCICMCAIVTHTALVSQGPLWE